MTSIDAYHEDRHEDRSWRPGRGFYQNNSDSIFQIKLRKAFTPPRHGGKFAPHFEKLDELSINPALLVEGGEVPTPFALARARAVLHQLEIENVEPTRVVASAEGGVGICFVDGDKYADIECFNNDQILGVISNRRDRPTIWKVEPSAAGFAAAASRIGRFLRATASADDEERQAS